MRKKFKRRFFKSIVLPEPPKWMKNDDLSIIYDDINILAHYGEVYYAYIVQANIILFKPTPYSNCPANIVFSMDHDAENPEMLKDIAHNIYSYKYSENPPNELKEIVECISDERTRYFNKQINIKRLNKSDLTVFFSTIMVFRDHLPDGILIGQVPTPVIACPNKCNSSIILPKKYWTKNFINQFWK